MERERRKVGVGVGAGAGGLIKVKRERDSSDDNNGQEENCGGSCGKRQKFENGCCVVTTRRDFADSEKKAAGIIMGSPPFFRVESPARWSIGIREGGGRGGRGGAGKNCSSSEVCEKIKRDMRKKPGEDSCGQPQMQQGRVPRQFSGFELDRVVVKQETPTMVEIRDKSKKEDEVFQAFLTHKKSSCPDLNARKVLAAASELTGFDSSRLTQFRSLHQQEGDDAHKTSTVPGNIQSRIRRTVKQEVDDIPTSSPLLWTSQYTQEKEEQKKLVSNSVATANPRNSSPKSDCLGQLQPKSMIHTNNASPALLTESQPPKFCAKDGLARPPHVLNHAPTGGLDTISARVTPYCSAKRVHNMWIHRFLSKGGVAQPAIGEVPLPGGGACGSSSSRQAITPHHHSSQILSEFRNPTKQESAIISQTESSVDTKIKAQRNMASNPSGPHLECNLSAAGGLVLGTLDSSVHQSSVHEGDGYGVDFPNKQSTILDDTAVMSAVRTWRTETGKYRENMSQSCSGKWGGAAPRCCFCGFPGHSVANCSETLDCELRELEKWAVEGVKMWVGGDILCLRCLGIGHWGAQCHLSVIEAASKAHEKAEFWRVNKTKWTGSCREEEEEQTKTVNRSRDVHDYISQDTEGVMCYNCNEMGHWARYCPRHHGSSDGRAQSSGSGKGHQISNSSGAKVRTSLGQGKLEAYVQLPSMAKPTQSAQARHLPQPEGERAICVTSKNNLAWESKSKEQRSIRKPKAEEGLAGVMRTSYFFLGDEKKIHHHALPISSAVKECERKTESQRRGPALLSTEAVHLQTERRPQLDGVIHSYKLEELSLRNQLPPVPNGMLAAVELIRLSRLDLQKWVNSPDLATRVKGFFLRLRFGRWEAQLGGTGYQMARIKGAVKKSAVEQTMIISVDSGATEYNVNGQYVSNQPFTEMELAEWWRGAWMKGKALEMESELQLKLNERQMWPVTL